MHSLAIGSVPNSAALSANDYFERGQALAHQGQLDAAAQAWQECLRIQPDHDAALNALLPLLRNARQHSRAAQISRQWSEAAPFNLNAYWSALYDCAFVCDWRQRSYQEEVVAGAVAHTSYYLVAGETTLTMPAMTAALQREAARRWSCEPAVAELVHAGPLVPRGQRYPGRKRLRLGYIGEDFHEQATAYLMAGVIELHDRQQFEVIGFDFGPQTQGPTFQRLRKSFDQVVSLHGMPPRAAAQRIRDAQIDIAIYTSRPMTAAFSMLALRPAPWQIAYLYYPATTGASYIDYLVADPIVAPAQERDLFVEQLLHLPHCYQPHDPQRVHPRATTRAKLGLPHNALVLANFNTSFKYTPAMFALWCQVLKQVPQAVLVLLEANAEATDRLRWQAMVHGVDAGRILFSPRMSTEDHLGRLRHGVDLVLDTHPYGSHTVGSDALWAGTPMLTLTGQTFASRVGASLLHAVGLPELIAHNPQQFVAMAVALCQQPQRLQALRAHLAHAPKHSPLFDTAGYVKDLEAAYLRVVVADESAGPVHASERQPVPGTTLGTSQGTSQGT